MEEPITPAEEVNNTDEPVIPEPKAEDKTVGELLEDKTVDTVPLKTFLDIKREKKDLEKVVSDLQEKAKAGATKSEVQADLKSIADKYEVDPNFLAELSTIIYAKAEENFNSKLKPIEAKEKADRINAAFEEHYNKVLDEMPEYADVINKNAIKALSLLPENSKKTFQQIIEETYGKTVTGKRTMETSTPRGGKDAGLDMSRIKDPEYFKEVMANPDLKKKYNEDLHTRINL